MLIFMLNSQLLSVSGDSKNTHTSTNVVWWMEWWMEYLERGSVFGLWLFCFYIVSYLYWKKKINEDGMGRIGKGEKHKENSYANAVSYYSCIHGCRTHSQALINLISFSLFFLFRFLSLGYGGPIDAG
jgi:hypothetical protein